MSKLEKAIQLVENGNPEQGLEILRKHKSECSHEEKFEIAETYFKWGLAEEAKEIIEELMFMYPDEGELAVFMAEILIDLDQEEEALTYLEDITERDSAYIQALILQADLYQMQGLHEVSEQKLLMAKQTMPEEQIIDFALAELFFSQAEYKKSISYYKGLIDNHDSIVGVNLSARLAEALSAIGEFEESLVHFQKAIKDAEDINTLFNYGFTALQAGYNITAIETFNRLKELDPEYYSLYLHLAKAYEQEGMISESYEAVTEGLKEDDLNKDLHYYGGKLAMKLGDQQAIEYHLRQAIAIDPGFVDATLALTKFLIHEKRFEDVVECLTEVMNYGEHDIQFDWDLAHSKNKLEEYSDALNHYRLAYTSFKDDRDFLEEYGYFLMEEGNREEAQKIFRELLKLEPTNIEIEELLLNLGY